MPRKSATRRLFEDESSDDEMPGPSSGRSRNRRHDPNNENFFGSQASQRSQATQRQSQSRPSQKSNRLSQNAKNRTARGSAMPQDETMADPYEFSQSTQRTKLPEEEEKSLIGSVIRYLLVADRPKNLIQRANIIKAALPNHSKYYKQIMAGVKPILREIFGYNLVELEGSKYILTNTLENSGPHIQFSESERAEQVLLFIALTHIFMSDQGGCDEEELFDLFRALEIIEDTDFFNEYFGDVKYLLTEKFVKQGYLDHVIVDKTDPPTKHYQWGVRAEKEVTPRHVLEFMSKIFDGCALNSWPKQFKMMQVREDSNRTD